MDGNIGIRTITKIEANPALFSRTADNRKLKVAAYCRVSTDEEDQLNSLETQMKYYTPVFMQTKVFREPASISEKSLCD